MTEITKNKSIVAIETILLFLISITDLITSIYWIPIQHDATEGNPLMAYYFTLGIRNLIIVKSIFILAPLVILEYAILHKPKFTKWGMRICASIYALSLILNLAWTYYYVHHSIN